MVILMVVITVMMVVMAMVVVMMVVVVIVVVCMYIRMYVYEHKAFSAHPIPPGAYALLIPMPRQPYPSLYGYRYPPRVGPRTYIVKQVSGVRPASFALFGGIEGL